MIGERHRGEPGKAQRGSGVRCGACRGETGRFPPVRPPQSPLRTRRRFSDSSAHVSHWWKLLSALLGFDPRGSAGRLVGGVVSVNMPF